MKQGKPGTKHSFPGPAREVRLSRGMRLLDVTMIGVGAMIGAGIFVLTGIAAGVAGPALLLVFLLNGLVTAITAMAYAELGSCFPGAGGGYLWVKEGLPGPNGFLSGWMSWFAQSVACSLYALGFGAYLGQMLDEFGLSVGGWSPHVLAKFLAVLVCALFTFINYRGASETGKAGIVVSLAKIILLGAFAASGLWVMWHLPSPLEHLTPFMPRGWGGVFVGMALTFIAFEGYEIIAQCGEEVKNPRRNIPRAIFLSLGMVLLIYLLVAFVALGAIQPPAGQASWQYLGEKAELAMVEAARLFMVGGGRWGAALLIIGGLFSTMSALNATLYSSSRVSFAMGRDHHLPEIFARVHPVRHTPFGALLLSSSLIIIMALALPLKDVASACNIMFLLLFMQVNMAVLVLRRKRPDLPRGFQVPFTPVLPLLAVAANFGLAVVLFSYSPTAWYVTLAWIAVGLGVYYNYARHQERRAVVSRVVAEHLPVERHPYRVLAALANPEHVTNLMYIAGAAAQQHNGEVVALSVVAVPELLPLEAGRRFFPQGQQALRLAERRGHQWGLEVATIGRIGHSVPRAVLETVEEEKPALLIFGWRGWTQTSQRVLGTTLDPVLRRAPCNVAVLKASNPLPEVRRILVGVTASPHSDLAIEMAQALQEYGGAEVTYLHVVKRGTPMDPRVQRRYADVLRGKGSRNGIPELHVVEDSSTAVGIIKASRDKDLILIGAAREHPLHQLFFGTKAHTVAKLSPASVLLVKRGPARWRAMLQDLLTPSEDGRPVEVPEETEEE